MRPQFPSNPDQARTTVLSPCEPRSSLRIVSGVLAVTLAVMPTPAWAAPAKAEKTEEAEPADTEAEAEGEAPEDEAAEGEQPEDDGDGEAQAEDEAEAAEGEDAGAEDGSAEGEAQGAAEAEAEAEPEAAEPEPAPEATQPPPPDSFAPDPATDRPEEPMINGKPRKGIGLMIAGGSTLAVGLATTITFGLMTRHCSYDGPLQCKYQDQDDFLIPLGASITLLGTMMLAVGVGYHLHYKRWQSWTPERAEQQKRRKQRRRRGKKKSETALVPNVGRNGAGLSWVGRF